MLPDPKVMCPHTGFSKSCRSIVSEHDCPKFVKISGVNPNDGQPVDKFGCIDSFLHMLLIENSQQQRQTGAAVEGFRNEMVRANEASFALMLQRKPTQERQITEDRSRALSTSSG
jgi:hypothetical protein